MRVVIACCGLEHTKRGYESFSRELFGALSGKISVTLCKGSGKRSQNELVVPCLRRDFLGRFMNADRAFYWEQITFALALVPYLILNRVDIVHYSEGRMGNALIRFVRWAGLQTKLIHSNGAPNAPMHFRPDVAIHQICGECEQDALRYGITPDRMHLVPYGIDPERFRSSQSRDAAREKFGLPQQKFIILCVAALTYSHKRLDYLIREVAALADDSFFLCMAGQPTPEAPFLKRLAAELLPQRHVFITVPRGEIPDLQAAADLFVLASLSEGLPMVLLEACAAGVPVVCHNSPHFQWALGDSGIYNDMAVSGNLTERIRELANKKDILCRHRLLGKARVQSHYSWNVLVPRYLAMYKSVFASGGD